MEKIAVYPGTFDPLTNGHVSLVKRGLRIFDTIILAIAYNSPKKTLFSLKERVSLAKEVFKNEPKVKVESFEGLLMDYVNKKKAVAILRGLRAVSDFEYEFQMALMNRKLSPEVQTVFLMTDYKWLYISSTIIKEVASLGGNVEGLVPKSIEKALKAKYAKI
ncbi:Phosphopantetheine adenylyltransferase [Desulfonauticus submarinus]|uniref:Phosphopantetheine adenylyltransferase n=1 Tax=Desulfonauticus submarinus TaxID=206665 RepID=A0A1H0E9P9_9BACT|nr:pantetheine-phosphate adenylyltransferase [Desulfonauticus submarinus]SDN79065.1 Phosphopantetheine adenylyltransferase [Desulfonauticus submarinus]